MVVDLTAFPLLSEQWPRRRGRVLPTISWAVDSRNLASWIEGGHINVEVGRGVEGDRE